MGDTQCWRIYYLKTQGGHCSGKDTLSFGVVTSSKLSLEFVPEDTVKVREPLVLEMIPAHNSGGSLFR